ncbi:hypothetical protein FACS189474_3220 [Bacteroidia bacterium]|nr:hypothetical protein FACS189474_3220 [Bacteroidia bacterium]
MATTMANNSILIDILSIGRDFLEEKKEINTDELKSELCKKGHSEDDIENALELFYPENFKNKYNKGSWLSSDGHIRLLQYESLKSSESNLALAKENSDTAKADLAASTQNLQTAEKSLSRATWTLSIAIVTMLASIAMPMIMPLLDKSDKQFQDNIIAKQDSIISLLQQTVIRQDSIIVSPERRVNRPVQKDTATIKMLQNPINLPQKKCFFDTVQNLHIIYSLPDFD